jgi:ATP-binding cassette subfamily B multidrug efflux pump
LRLFAQLSWYFRREWRRYLGAIALLAIIAVLQLIPPKVVGIVVDGVTNNITPPRRCGCGSARWC